ncbi:nucleotidyltransferase domain protein [Delftia acidovorans]|nr:nucleotidyltransferase domain-containing protein [Delftia acidovorans]KFJ11579.1 nucleotidyltransferase domain protein [Delftia acidovorans]QQB52494.1 nucleotidyltransferase domain-containing protein [Delftia acidovorans]
MHSCSDPHAPRTLDLIPNDPVQPEFQRLEDDARAAIASALGEALDSLYLYGSVARGCARAGFSDLDLTIVLARPLSRQESSRLEQLRQDLQLRHKEVVKIDFDLGTRQEVLDPAHLYSWGYWLKHECRCIHGEDLAQQFEAFEPSRAIAQAVNGDYVQVLNDYLQRIAATRDDMEALRLQREAARKLIRATNVLRPCSGGFWPRTLEEFADCFAQLHPEMAQSMAFFLAQSRTPEAPRARFNAELSAFISWIRRQRAASTAV